MEKSKLILLSWFLVILLAYVIHGAPSEAYFPVLFVPLSFAWGLLMTKSRTKIGVGIIFVVLILASWQVFYLLTHRMMTYGLGLEQRFKIAQFITEDSGKAEFELKAEGPGSEFPSFLDNYRYLCWFLGKPPRKGAGLYYIIVENQTTILDLKKSTSPPGKIFEIEGVLVIKNEK